MKAALHPFEGERLAALRAYDILDTPRESDFDDVVRVVSAICKAPISVINLIDDGRQWFKAEVGLGVRETPIDSSICAHAILQPGLMIVPDTTRDNRLKDNPLVTGEPHLRFYAGALLQTSDGLPLGTVCVLDYEPRTLDEDQKALLLLMASQVMKLLDLRRANTAERLAREQAEVLLSQNAVLAREGDHRVMNSLQLVQSILDLQARKATSRESKAELEAARDRVSAIATVHRQLHLSGSLAEVDARHFLTLLCENLRKTAPPSITDVSVSADPMYLASDQASTIGLIVAELVINAYKHAYVDGRSGAILVAFTREGDRGWRLSVEDRGRGLPPDFRPEKSSGIGMRVLIALARRLDATLTHSSSTGGTTFVVRREHNART